MDCRHKELSGPWPNRLGYAQGIERMASRVEEEGCVPEVCLRPLTPAPWQRCSAHPPGAASSLVIQAPFPWTDRLRDPYSAQENEWAPAFADARRQAHAGPRVIGFCRARSGQPYETCASTSGCNQ